MKFPFAFSASLSAFLVSSVQSKTANAVFNNAGVSGTVVFEQGGPNDAVSISVNFEGLANRAGGYHVHELPVNFGGSGFQFNSFDDSGCGFDITADHFNPLLVQGGANNKEEGLYLCSQEEHEKCEAGDISGKFGSLKDKDSFSGDFLDGGSGLTLFGEHSIIGRSMVIHRTDSSRLLCANIFEDEVEYKKVVVTFDRESSGVEGTVSFLQPRNGQGDTVVFTNLELAAGFRASQASLSWTVNSLPVLFTRDSDKAVRCSSTSVGDVAVDLTSLLEPLQLQKGVRTKILRTVSSELDLTDKSLVLSDTSGVVDCSELGKTARVEFAVGDVNSNGVVGDILFRQTSEFDPITVSLNLNGLEARANNFHVHTLPVFVDCLSTTGHFNPLQVVGGDGVPGLYQCDKTTPDLCEAGDLSGRFGGLLGRSDVGYSFSDTGAGLTLFGANSIVGRSVVIHGVDGPSRLACGNIKEVGKLAGEKTVFNRAVNEVQGQIVLSQRAVDPDAETTIEFDITRNDGQSTSRHMFHIHEAPVSGSNVCTETGGHFSPSGVNGGANQQSVSYRCAEGAEFCEIGDISGKHGLADLPNKFVLTDLTVPLTGVFSIADLSITFHDEGQAPDRIDCANLQSFKTGFPNLILSSSSDDESNANNAGLVVTAVLFFLAAAALAIYVVQLKMRQKHTEKKLSRAEEQVDGHFARATL